MKCAAIIAEYNPFHNGHAWQIQKTREEGGADHIAVLMSPDYVQRGTPAFADKYARAEMALAGGADLVLEMPVRTAVSAAGDFAGGSVKILNALGCIDLLSFGSESGDLNVLSGIAKILAHETPDFRESLADALKEGATFAAARQLSLEKILGIDAGRKTDSLKALMSAPNNILALEYLSALIRTGSSITPFTMKRIGEGYHFSQAAYTGPYPSAEAIRQICLEKGLSFVSGSIPPAPFGILREYLDNYGPWERQSYDRLLHYALLLTDPSGIMDASPEIANRIASLAGSYEDAESFALLIKTKQYTLTRIRRVLLHLFLRLEKEAPCPEPSYVRILGFRTSAAPLLKTLKANTSIPLITKPASAGKLLSAHALAGFEEDVRCSSLYRLLQPKKKRENEYTRSPIVWDDRSSLSS